MQTSVNGNREGEGVTCLSVGAAAVKRRVKVGYAITLFQDALWLGSLSYASTRLIAALGSARPRLPRRLVPRRTLIQPDGLTVCCCSNPGAPHWFKPGKAGWRK